MAAMFLKRLFARNGPRPITNDACGNRLTILLISTLQSERNTVRLFSLLNQSRLLVAQDVSTAIELQNRQNVTLVLYDDDLPGISWQDGIKAVLAANRRPVPLLFSLTQDEARRAEVIALGGFDI